MQKLWIYLAPLALLLAATNGEAADGEAAEVPDFDLLKKGRRVIFLGDSITASGQYVANFDAWLLAQDRESRPTIINCGLPSETVSGLSEEGHAGGKFPRPDLAERLDRVLALTKPDLVFACYGINCGIYQPFDEIRFRSYQQGMNRLKAKVEDAHATLVVITPPCYDDQRSPRPFLYNDVLDRYSEWLLAQRQHGWLVVDLHGPMTKEVASRRKREAHFTFQPDGVHPDDAGHWFMAQQLIRYCGDKTAVEYASPAEFLAQKDVPAEVLPLVKQRMNLLKDAYVSAAGHKRPRVGVGLPVPDAERKAAELSAQIADALQRAQASNRTASPDGK